ncbi:MAG: hypothetical protein ACKV2O_17080 [Acidimicrobiales bacterium]
MSADIVAALQELLVDVCDRGCDASRLGELQQIANLAVQVLREGALAAQREEHWVREGFRSPGVWVAAHTGLPRFQASGLLREAAALEHMPHSQTAARAGTLCGADVRLLTDCQREDPARYDEGIDATLVGLAGTGDLANAVRHWKACAQSVNDPDPALQPEPQQEPEWLRLTGLLDGRGRIEGELNAENFAIVQAAIDKGVAGYLNNRRNGDETLAGLQVNELRAQALVDLANLGLRDRPGHGTRNGRHRVVVVLRLDEHGRPQPEGPVPAGAFCDSAFMRVVLGANGEVLDVGRDIRSWPDPIANAIRVRDRHCTYPGCDRPPSWADIHHCHPWETGGETKITNGTLLCRWHHTYIHRHKWTVKLDEHQKPIFRKPDGTVLHHQPCRPQPQTAQRPPKRE